MNAVSAGRKQELSERIGFTGGRSQQATSSGESFIRRLSFGADSSKNFTWVGGRLAPATTLHHLEKDSPVGLGQL